MARSSSGKADDEQKKSRKTVNTGYVAPENVPAKLGDFVGEWLPTATALKLEFYEDRSYSLAPPRFPIAEGEPPSWDDACSWFLVEAQRLIEHRQDSGEDVPTALVARIDTQPGGGKLIPRRAHLTTSIGADGVLKIIDGRGRPVSRGSGGVSSEESEVVRGLELANEQVERYADLTFRAMQKVVDSTQAIAEIAEAQAGIITGVSRVVAKVGAANAEVIRAQTEAKEKAADHEARVLEMDYEFKAGSQRTEYLGQTLLKVAENLSPELAAFLRSKMAEHQNPDLSPTAAKVANVLDQIKDKRHVIEDAYGEDVLALLDQAATMSNEDEAFALTSKAIHDVVDQGNEKLEAVAKELGSGATFAIMGLAQEVLTREKS